MKNLRYFIVFTLVALAGCGGTNGFSVSSQTEVTDKNITPGNPLEIPKTQTIIGFVTLQKTNLQLDKIAGKYFLTGHYQFVDKNSAVLSSRDFSLSGKIQAEGASSLYPAGNEDKSEQVRARFTCLENDVDGFCHSLIVDFYLKKDSQVYATQVLITLDSAPAPAVVPAPVVTPKEEVKAEPAPTTDKDQTDADRDDDDDDDDTTNDDGGLYVGTLHEDPEPLFKEQSPSEEAPATKPEVAPTAPPAVAPPTQSPAPAPSIVPSPVPAVAPPKPVPAPLLPAPVTPTPPTAPSPIVPAETKPTPGPAPAPSLKPVTPAPKPPSAPAPSPKIESATPVVPKPVPRPPTAPAPVPSPRPESAPSADLPRPRDQVVGLANAGHLEKASNLFEMLTKLKDGKIHLLYPERKHFFGSYELTQDLLKMSTFLDQHVPGDKVTIGDMSQQQGGQLFTNNRKSSHKSHQNGLDVDISFPRKNDKTPALTDVTQGRGVIPNLRLEETYLLFEYAHVGLQAVDRIFAAAQVKRAMCQMAKSKGLLDENDKGRAAEVLRHVRPDKDHITHFHMRIRCSTQQPRCRMIAEPPSGSGCKGL